VNVELNLAGGPATVDGPGERHVPVHEAGGVDRRGRSSWRRDGLRWSCRHGRCASGGVRRRPGCRNAPGQQWRGARRVGGGGRRGRGRGEWPDPRDHNHSEQHARREGHRKADECRFPPSGVSVVQVRASLRPASIGSCAEYPVRRSHDVQGSPKASRRLTVTRACGGPAPCWRLQPTASAQPVVARGGRVCFI
jgi:hypothetical protein